MSEEDIRQFERVLLGLMAKNQGEAPLQGLFRRAVSLVGLESQVWSDVDTAELKCSVSRK